MDKEVTVKNNHDSKTVELHYIVDTVCPICKGEIMEWLFFSISFEQSYFGILIPFCAVLN